MFFNVALFSTLLLIPAVLAVPFGLGTRVARRGEGDLSQISNRLERAASVGTYINGVSAGAVLQKSDGTFSSVTGTFTVPTVSGVDGVFATIAVAIDGNVLANCTGGEFLSGVYATIQNGQPIYGAYYIWDPTGIVQPFSDITVSPGDIIRAYITTSSTTTGTATVENLTNGQTVSESITSTIPLCRGSVGWRIIDWDLDNNGALLNFGTVTFSEAEAFGSGDYTPIDATIFEIEQNNQVVTSTSVTGSSVTIEYL